MKKVSVVIIGYNEERNLESTFKAIYNINLPNYDLEVVYVDSGSTDNSVGIAKRYTDKIYIERAFYPTAARGRNRGLREATGEIVHFIDGDVEINPDYLSKALEILCEKNVQAVTGKLVEKRANNNFYSKLLSSAWEERQDGLADATQAGGTYVKEALLSINGYDERIKMGEETELGLRFLNAGYKIYYINIEMGKHDYAINSFRDFISIFIRQGEAKSVQMLQKDKSLYYKSVRLSAIKNLAFNIASFLLLIIIILLNVYFLPVLIICYLLVLFFKYYFIRKIRNKYQLIYYIVMNLMKPFTFGGQLKILIRFALSAEYRNRIIMEKIQMSSLSK